MTVVDDEDADLAAFNWCASKGKKTFYALRNVRKDDGRWTMEKLHRVIADRMGIVGEVDLEEARRAVEAARKAAFGEYACHG